MSDAKNIDWESVSDADLIEEVNERGLSGEFHEHYSANDYTSEELREVLRNRGDSDEFKLEQIWLAFRGKDAPQCLADYLWATIGKAL